MSRSRGAAALTWTGRTAYWVLPSLFCLGVYWFGLQVWFQQDDFAWLSLSRHIHSAADLWEILFRPMAQGTIRPWSERAFFALFYELFGLDALPFRLMVFATQFLNLILLSAVARRVAGSKAAGFLAPLLWLVNPALIEVMSWTSVYNQAMCAFFLLLALFLLIRYTETGRRSFLIGQWVVFLFGFGALEINIVYPAIALAYALIFARKHWKLALPLFVPSVVFFLVHRMVAPPQTSMPYRMHFDAALPGTLWRYWQMALGPLRFLEAFKAPDWFGPAATLVFTAALLWFVWRRWRAEDPRPLFGLAWFLGTLAPVLPLRDHISDYYLTIPVIGLAMTGAMALVAAWKAGTPGRLAAVTLCSGYMVLTAPVSFLGTHWNYQRTSRFERLLGGVASARQLHPDKSIVLEDVDDELFWGCILDRPFRLVGVENVYLAPGSEKRLTPHPGIGEAADYVLPPGPTLSGLERGQVAVYSTAGRRLRNITASYAKTAQQRLATGEPRRVDVGNPLLSYLMGPEWYRIEDRARWMPRKATLRIGGPHTPEERLHISGYYPPAELAKGPLGITVKAEGILLGKVFVESGHESFTFDFPLPAQLVGRASIQLEVEVDRTIKLGRELGVIFSVFEIQ